MAGLRGKRRLCLSLAGLRSEIDSMADGRALSNWLLSFSFDCISNKGLIGVRVHWRFHPYDLVTHTHIHFLQ
jgi:hypothetical protein